MCHCRIPGNTVFLTEIFEHALSNERAIQTWFPHFFSALLVLIPVYRAVKTLFKVRTIMRSHTQIIELNTQISIISKTHYNRISPNIASNTLAIAVLDLSGISLDTVRSGFAAAGRLKQYAHMHKHLCVCVCL